MRRIVGSAFVQRLLDAGDDHQRGIEAVAALAADLSAAMRTMAISIFATGRGVPPW